MLTGFEEKEKPENALFSGFLASPARFERAAFRLGELQLRMALKARRRLDKTQKASNLGKIGIVYYAHSNHSKIACSCKVQSKCSQKCSQFIIIGTSVIRDAGSPAYRKAGQKNPVRPGRCPSAMPFTTLETAHAASAAQPFSFRLPASISGSPD